MDRQLQQMLADAQAMALKAGEIQLSYFRGDNLDIHTKRTDADVVTAADKASERHIIAEIHRLYPDHSILAEESGEERRDSDWEWVVDPLDGTTNFSNGLPLFSVSIGVEYRGLGMVGVVYAPYLREMFTACRGHGARLNGHPISVGTKTDLKQCVVATGFPVDKDRNRDNNLQNVARVLPEVRGMRRLGSAAIDLCYVAAGFLDGYWELDLHQWDVSAGSLMVEEAGGMVMDFRTDRNRSIIAASRALHGQLSRLILK